MSVIEDVKALVAEYEPAVREKLADVVGHVKGWTDAELDELVAHLRGEDPAEPAPVDAPPADGAGDPDVPDPATDAPAESDGSADAGTPETSAPESAPAA